MSKLSNELKKYSSLKRKKANEWFFKSGNGGYGEGDKFIGVSVPYIRKVTKKFYGKFDLKDIERILNSPIHEERLAGLFILVEDYKRGKNKRKIFNFYIRNAKKINNWDLVDSSASKIVGDYLVENEKEKSILYKLARSKNLWERRISIISTLAFIKIGNITDTLKISRLLIKDNHDLIKKAVGWMLREAWKKNSKEVEKFLINNYEDLSRTTLRYAIERMEEKKRKRFLNHI